MHVQLAQDWAYEVRLGKAGVGSLSLNFIAWR
jgi:hypothetical protein